MLNRFTSKISEKYSLSKAVLKTDGLIPLLKAITLYFIVKLRYLREYIQNKYFENEEDPFRKIEDLNYRVLYKRLLSKRLNKREAISKLKQLKSKITVKIYILYDNNNLSLLKQTLNSLKEQFIDNFEVIICSDKDKIDNADNWQRTYRYSIHFNNNITKDSFLNILDSDSDYIFTVISSGDIFEPNALFEIIQTFNYKNNIGLVYSDEDWYQHPEFYHSPFFKPDYSPHYLNSFPYIGNLTFYHKKLILSFNKLKIPSDIKELPLFLNLYINGTDLIVNHISDILIHTYNEGQINLKSKNHVYLDILRRYYTTIDKDTFHKRGIISGTFMVGKSNYKEDLISIIIPFNDKVDLLRTCINSILNKTLYTNFEIILISNNSKEKETLEYLGELSGKDERIFIYHKDIPFNYSLINNFGVTKSKGKYLLFLNNDTEVISPEWLNSMMEQILFNNVGVVGAKLIYPDGKIQHAGVVTGFGGCADHVFVGFNANEEGYFNRLNTINNYSACTGACLLVKKELFEKVKGFDQENLTINFNDVDLCLKIRNLGYYIVYTPYSELIHHESASRGRDNIEDNTNRIKYEIAFIKDKWKTHIECDPFYNSNLALGKKDFSLRV